MERSNRILAVAAFFVIVSVAILALLAQWLVVKLSNPDARMDIGEWPFVIVGVLLALLPTAAAVRILGGHPTSRLGRWAAAVIGIIGVIALAQGLLLLTMGVAWNLLIGGAVMVSGAVFAWRSLRPKALAPNSRGV